MPTKILRYHLIQMIQRLNKTSMSGGCDSGGTQDTDRNLSVVRTVDMYFLSQRHNDTTEIPCERDDDARR